nr:F-box domain, galactose oxidase, beta-propeller [Tanacetum cinerariifolium]
VVYDDYEEASVFDDDQYEEEIVSEDFGREFGEEEDTSEDTELREHHTNDKDCDETYTRQILDHSVAELFIKICMVKCFVSVRSLKQRIQELEFPQLQQNSPTKEAETESNVWDEGSEDANPFGGGNHGFYADNYDNPLLRKETELEPIIWDIGDEEEEYPFVNKYLNFQEEPCDFARRSSS